MSLSGRLEDLLLRDLLQIICLSGNSGQLQLQRGDARGELLFRDGGLVSVRVANSAQPAASSRTRDTKSSSGFHQAFEAQGGLAGKGLAFYERAAVSAAVQELLEWTEGSFIFQAGALEEISLHEGWSKRCHLDPPMGVQELLAPAPAELPAKSGAEDAESASEPDAEGAVSVLLVDDDPRVGSRLVQALKERGLAARAFSSGGALLDAVDAALRAGRRPLLIIDLIMPRLHGGGLLGGLELMERVRGISADLPCLVYSEHPCAEAAQYLQRLGVAELLHKPKVAFADLEEPAAFYAELASRVADVLADCPPPVAAPPPPSQGAVPGSQVVTAPCAETDLLKGMLQELRAVDSGDQIMLLVLRFATEVLSRAVLFSVGRDLIFGLGQFGFGAGDSAADERVRGMAIPLGEKGILAEVVRQQVPRCCPLTEDDWDRYLARELGLCPTGEVFIGPLLSGGRVVALLCGDRAPDTDYAAKQDLLEIFLLQAGVALEKLQMADNLRNLSALLGKSFQ